MSMSGSISIDDARQMTPLSTPILIHTSLLSRYLPPDSSFVVSFTVGANVNVLVHNNDNGHRRPHLFTTMSTRRGALGTLAIASRAAHTARLARAPFNSRVPPSAVAGPSRLPTLIEPSLAASRRTLLTYRAAKKPESAFWVPSYPTPESKGSTWVPSIPPQPASEVAPPPLPSPSAVTVTEDHEGSDADGSGDRQRRKERYLDSLMDKAGELGLQCE